ncbi:MAG: alkaline phosphatase family protein [Rikenellaceae bacterium]|jgi:hypothetical protein|nr:alkaline phosphatase family protein [Rikenellaceae bacterium]
MPKSTFFAVFACALLTGLGREGAAQTRQHPKLIVEIVVSGMRYDYLDHFSANFQERGFRTFIQHGVNCTNARYNYMGNNTPAGLSTLVSGANPSTHGIVAQRWIDFTTNLPVEAGEDLNYYGVGGTELFGQHAPTRITVSTIGDEIKRKSAQSRVISLALDPTSAILAGGTAADAAYWFDTDRGRWGTSTYYFNRLPAWVEGYNNAGAANAYNQRVWTMSLAPDKYRYDEGGQAITTPSRRSGIAATIGFSLESLFRRQPEKSNYAGLRLMPIGTEMLMEFARQTILAENLGKDEHPDLLVITIDPTRHIAEAYGPESAEIEDAYYRLDRDLQETIDLVESTVGKENAVFVLTADHGTSDTRRAENRQPVGRFNVMQFKVLMNGFLNTQYGAAEWVTDYRNRNLYLNHRLVFEQGLNLTEMQEKTAAFALQLRGVAQAMTGSSLQNNYFGGGSMEKIQNGFYPKHSGDVVVNLLPGWIEDDDRTSATGSIYEYDAHVPLMWYGGGLRAGEVHRPVDMTDVAPTMARLIGVNRPDAATGNEITEVVSGW